MGPRAARPLAGGRSRPRHADLAGRRRPSRPGAWREPRFEQDLRACRGERVLIVGNPRRRPACRAGRRRLRAAVRARHQPGCRPPHVPLRRIPPTAVNVHGHLHHAQSSSSPIASPANVERGRGASAAATATSPAHTTSSSASRSPRAGTWLGREGGRQPASAVLRRLRASQGPCYAAGRCPLGRALQRRGHLASHPCGCRSSRSRTRRRAGGMRRGPRLPARKHSRLTASDAWRSVHRRSV